MGLFKKRKKKNSKDSRYYNLIIRDVVKIAQDTVNLVFEKPDDKFNYSPGQFITIIQNISGKKIRRAYSLCSSPYIDEYPAVTVKRTPGGIMSNYINDTFIVGQEVQVMEPMGMFTTKYDNNRSRHAVFFGGGSGITPLFSIIKTLLLKEPRSRISLVYGNRKKEFIIFKDELEKMNEMHSNFNLIHILEENNNAEADYKGIPTPEMIADITKSMHVEVQTEFFICGPEPMMNVIKEGLSLAGVQNHQIFIESFEAGKTSPAEIIEDETASELNSEITIVLDGESYSLTLDKSKPVLEQALKSELDMPYSCQSGLCTACRGKCLEGEISVDEAEGLTQEELDEGYVLLCVGKPISDKIHVEIG